MLSGGGIDVSIWVAGMVQVTFGSINDEYSPVGPIMQVILEVLFAF